MSGENCPGGCRDLDQIDIVLMLQLVNQNIILIVAIVSVLFSFVHSQVICAVNMCIRIVIFEILLLVFL